MGKEREGERERKMVFRERGKECKKTRDER